MTTFYCSTIEDALKRAKAAGKKPGCYYGGILLPSGRQGFAVYKEGKVVERYSYCSSRLVFPRRDRSLKGFLLRIFVQKGHNDSYPTH